MDGALILDFGFWILDLKAEGRRRLSLGFTFYFLLFTFYFSLLSLSESPPLLYPFQQLSLITYQLSLIPKN